MGQAVRSVRALSTKLCEVPRKVLLRKGEA